MVSGQHRLCAVIDCLEHKNTFHSQFHDFKGVFGNNSDVTVNYFVLRDETPDFVILFLLKTINSTAKTTSTPSGVWEFIPMYTYVCVCVCCVVCVCRVSR